MSDLDIADIYKQCESDSSIQGCSCLLVSKNQKEMINDITTQHGIDQAAQDTKDRATHATWLANKNTFLNGTAWTNCEGGVGAGTEVCKEHGYDTGGRPNSGNIPNLFSSDKSGILGWKFWVANFDNSGKAAPTDLGLNKELCYNAWEDHYFCERHEGGDSITKWLANNPEPTPTDIPLEFPNLYTQCCSNIIDLHGGSSATDITQACNQEILEEVRENIDGPPTSPTSPASKTLNKLREYFDKDTKEGRLKIGALLVALLVLVLSLLIIVM